MRLTLVAAVAAMSVKSVVVVDAHAHFDGSARNMSRRDADVDWCGTRQPTETELAAEREHLRQRRHRMRRAYVIDNIADIPPIRVPVKFVHFTASNGYGRPDRASCDFAIDEMNTDMAGTPTPGNNQPDIGTGPSAKIEFYFHSQQFIYDSRCWSFNSGSSSDEAYCKNLADGGNGDPKQYLYFFTTRFSQAGLLGFGYFPSWNLNENTMLWSVFVSLGESGGNLKTSPYQVTDLDSKKHTTAAHEVGHNFMLYHVFQGGCNDNDLVSDTPACQQLSDQGICSSTYNTCAGPGNDPLTNIMHYQRCRGLFTTEQVLRMHDGLHTYRPTALANWRSLWCQQSSTLTIATETTQLDATTFSVVVSSTGGNGAVSGTGTFTRQEGWHVFTVTDGYGCTRQTEIQLVNALTPTQSPTLAPTDSPTVSPTTSSPTLAPTESPSVPPTTASPTPSPTTSPSVSPTSPTNPPTVAPTVSPTVTPTVSPTQTPPTLAPSQSPTLSPTDPSVCASYSQTFTFSVTAAPVAPTPPPPPTAPTPLPTTRAPTQSTTMGNMGGMNSNDKNRDTTTDDDDAATTTSTTSMGKGKGGGNMGGRNLMRARRQCNYADAFGNLVVNSFESFSNLPTTDTMANVVLSTDVSGVSSCASATAQTVTVVLTYRPEATPVNPAEFEAAAAAWMAVAAPTLSYSVCGCGTDLATLTATSSAWVPYSGNGKVRAGRCDGGYEPPARVRRHTRGLVVAGAVVDKAPVLAAGVVGAAVGAVLVATVAVWRSRSAVVSTEQQGLLA